MARFILPHPTKGSPEAKAWAERMQAARKRKHQQRSNKSVARDPQSMWYRVALKGGRWKRGFRTLDEASAYAEQIRRRTGVFVAVESYRPRLNPGAAWHDGMATAAQRSRLRTDEPLEEVMYKGMEVAHRDSASAARVLGMNPRKRERVIQAKRVRKISASRKKRIGWQAAALINGKREISDIFKTRAEGVAWLKDLNRRGFVLGIPGVYQVTIPTPITHQGIPQKFRYNPLAVFGVGNPPKRLNTGIAGVVYSRCLEIRAEKTKFKPGLYRHPFSRKAGVQILALDSGDLLVHSTAGVNLWGPI